MSRKILENRKDMQVSSYQVIRLVLNKIVGGADRLGPVLLPLFPKLFSDY